MTTIFTKDKVADTETMYISASSHRPFTLQVDGALGTDEIAITGIGINGTDETTLCDASGDALVLSATIPRISFYEPIRVLLTKSVTTNDVGLMGIE